MTVTDVPLARPPAGPPSDGDEDVPRDLNPRLDRSDKIFIGSVRGAGLLVLVLIGSIAVFLGLQAKPTLSHYGFSFFTEYRWLPSQDILGIEAVLVGTVEVALVALIIAFPLALLTALFITEWAPSWLRPILVAVVDLMAAVPSIVYGLWGFGLMEPHATHVAKWLSKYLGWVPFFHVRTDVDYPLWDQSPGYTQYAGSVFIAAIAVSLMVFPMATSVMREVFSLAPLGQKEAAYALGSTRSAMVRAVVVPFGRGGIIGGTMLALGRALGETISVVLIITQAYEVKWNVLESGTMTISALIAQNFREATPSQLSALLCAGFILFLLTLTVNTIAAQIVARSRHAQMAEL